MNVMSVDVQLESDLQVPSEHGPPSPLFHPFHTRQTNRGTGIAPNLFPLRLCRLGHPCTFPASCDPPGPTGGTTSSLAGQCDHCNVVDHSRLGLD